MAEKMIALIREYIEGRAKTRLEKFDKEAEKSADDDLASKRAEELAQYQPNAWLSDAASRARQLSFATHPVKFTHTDAKGASSAYVSAADSNTAAYLTTDRLHAPLTDVVGNAAALDVAQLLQLEVDGVSLANMIKAGDMSALLPFADDADQLEEWRHSFQQVFVDKEIRSHSLSKQLYFPVADGEYHLLSPLFSSSLAQAIYQRISDSRYTEVSKELRKLKKEGKFSEQTTVDFPNVALQKFGGTKPQNVSQGNSRRGGKAFLLSCQPPVWRDSVLPSLQHKNAFWQAYGRRYNRQAWYTVMRLKTFLTAKLHKGSNLAMRDHRAELIDELIDMLFQYAAELQGMHEHTGWTAKSRLSRAEQLWLDPERDDAQFQIERAAKDWQQEIADQFAGWLNFHLKSDKLKMKDTEHLEWKKLLHGKLKRFKEDLQYDLGGFAA